MIREPLHPPAPTPEPQARSRLRALWPALTVVAAVVVFLPSTTTAATPTQNHPPRGLLPASSPPADTTAAHDRTVNDTLRALDRLHSYGYTIDTPARADRAIRHWQTANGLTVDGQVGPETLASLHLDPAAIDGHVRRGRPVQPTPPNPAPANSPNVAQTGDAETIIRDVWPDDAEDRAVAIAMRESRLQSGARNACCYGLFQIHWQAHRAWLADLGIVTPSQLLDPTTNATVALALYQSAGWTPWNL